jgi:hypothetical protein
MLENRKLIIIGVLVALLWFISMVVVFKKGKDRESLSQARVPQETIDFFNEFLNSFDIKLTFNPNPSDEDWDNDRNYGEDEKTGLKKIEDEYFIVYFDDKAKEYEKAVTLLEYAHQAIPELIELMDKYFYPSDVNGRKLPVYLASDSEKYITIFQILHGTDQTPGGNSVGLYISTYSIRGNVTTGILLHPRIWEINRHSDYARRVLWHEMNHYVFFASLQYDKVVKPYTWVYEGLAEYFSMPEITELNRHQIDLCQTLSLSNTFSDTYSNYWAGQTIYQFFELYYSKDKLKNFIQYSYANSTGDALSNAFTEQVVNIETRWHKYVKSISDSTPF